jgi:hypothetical protein
MDLHSMKTFWNDWSQTTVVIDEWPCTMAARVHLNTRVVLFRKHYYGYGGLCVSKLAIKVAGVMMMPLITTRTAAIFLTTSGITWDTWWMQKWGPGLHLTQDKVQGLYKAHAEIQRNWTVTLGSYYIRICAPYRCAQEQHPMELDQMEYDPTFEKNKMMHQS